MENLGVTETLVNPEVKGLKESTDLMAFLESGVAKGYPDKRDSPEFLVFLDLQVKDMDSTLPDIVRPQWYLSVQLEQSNSGTAIPWFISLAMAEAMDRI